MLSTVLIVVLLLLLIGALPTWPYSSQWGYGPGGIVGALLAIVLVMALIGRAVAIRSRRGVAMVCAGLRNDRDENSAA